MLFTSIVQTNVTNTNGNCLVKLKLKCFSATLDLPATSAYETPSIISPRRLRDAGGT